MLAQGGYSFASRKAIGDQKSIFFAKLTDSASQALDYYLRNQGKFKEKPKIEFADNAGYFQIPAACGNDFGTEKGKAHFRFDIDSNVSLQGQQGRFECIRHKNGSRQLVKVGSFVKRLRIHANEDVYEKTKNRIAAIDWEQKQNCTVQLDCEPVSCKVKTDRNSKRTAVSSAVDNGRVSKTQPTKNTKPKAQSLPKTCNPSLMKRPLKERIIHMLAVRPYRKIELSAALRKDGIRATDKGHLISTMISVATLKGNVFHLPRHAWNDVQEDWPFYTEDERQKMKRNKPQNLTPPSSDSGISVSSNQSPSRTTAGESPSCQYKRPGYINSVDGFQVKRPRISHFTKPKKQFNDGNEENVQQISPSRITNCFDEIIAKSGLSNTAIKNPPLRSNSRQNAKPVANTFGAIRKETSTKVSCDNTRQNGRNSSNLNIVPHSDVFDSAPASKDFDHVVDESPAAQLGFDKFSGNFDSYSVPSSNTAMSMSPLPMMSDLPSGCSMFSNDSSRLTNVPTDYLKRYVTITDLNQRRKYKADFMKFFAEYQIIFEEITKVTEVFAQLGDRLKQHVKGSLEFQITSDEIVRRYQLCKEVKFCETKERFNYLHDMLSHIKRLVYEYDETLP